MEYGSKGGKCFQLAPKLIKGEKYFLFQKGRKINKKYSIAVRNCKVINVNKEEVKAGKCKTMTLHRYLTIKDTNSLHLNTSTWARKASLATQQRKSLWLMYSGMILWTNFSRNILSASCSELVLRRHHCLAPMYSSPSVAARNSWS